MAQQLLRNAQRSQTRSPVIIVAVVLALCVSALAAARWTARAGAATPSYQCGVGHFGEILGRYNEAGVIGWEGDHDGVIACEDGSFYVRDGKNMTYGFGIYNTPPQLNWSAADGYLPALTTQFASGDAEVSITNFADRVTVGGNAYVAAYSRVSIHNQGSAPISADPQPAAGLIPLNTVPVAVLPHQTVNHDYVVAADRFGNTYPWPADAALAAAGGFAAHFAMMQAYWNKRLRDIANIAQLPDQRLVDAYKAAFVDTQIIKDGDHLNTGENGYDIEFSHDVIGILANLFTQGDFSNAHDMLLRARDVIGSQRQFDDGVWKYSWLWALYLLKTGDINFVRANFATDGPLGDSQPSIENTAHQIAADRTGPGGIMRATNDIDANGFWSIDDYAALFGLTAYRYVAARLGETSEATWATQEYDALLAAVNSTLSQTIATNHIDYIPCSLTQPNDDNRCSVPEDANWAAPFLFGRWGWDGFLFGARQTGPAIDLIDNTYAYGFARLQGDLPADDFGGFPWYSSGYNAGYGSWGLAGRRYRDETIRAYQFMIDNTQSGPYSWWEQMGEPEANPWSGTHPVDGIGSSPHAWAMADNNKALLDSLVALKSDGTLIVGRGVPTDWLTSGKAISVTNFPAANGRRIGVRITTHGNTVSLNVTGAAHSDPVLFELPTFANGVSSVSGGATYRGADNAVVVRPGTHTVAVRLMQQLTPGGPVIRG